MTEERLAENEDRQQDERDGKDDGAVSEFIDHRGHRDHGAQGLCKAELACGFTVKDACSSQHRGLLTCFLLFLAITFAATVTEDFNRDHGWSLFHFLFLLVLGGHILGGGGSGGG